MKPLTFWFDPISPYAYLAFEHLPQALEGCSYSVDYRPVLFAGLLGHWGQLGPAEIEPKRAWTFRQVAWHAHTLGIPMDTPAMHPFNPLSLLRLGLASAPPAWFAEPARGRAADAPCLARRRRCQRRRTIARIGRGGGAAARCSRRSGQGRVARPHSGGHRARRLRRADDRARRPAVLGPGCAADGARRAAGDAWFDGPAWQAAAVAPPGVVRAG